MLRIGEIRSLLPDQARIITLTATATEKLWKTASSIIGLRDEVVVSKSPCKTISCMPLWNLQQLKKYLYHLLRDYMKIVIVSLHFNLL